MSASSNKKLRSEQNAAKMAERKAAEQKEAKKLKLMTTLFTVALALIVVVAVVFASVSKAIVVAAVITVVSSVCSVLLQPARTSKSIFISKTNAIKRFILSSPVEQSKYINILTIHAPYVNGNVWLISKEKAPQFPAELMYKL